MSMCGERGHSPLGVGLPQKRLPTNKQVLQRSRSPHLHLGKRHRVQDVELTWHVMGIRR